MCSTYTLPHSNYVSFNPWLQIHWLFMAKDFEETKCDGFKGLSLQSTNSNFSSIKSSVNQGLDKRLE